MIGRILRSSDFERVLRVRSRASSDHFALHHLPGAPGPVLARAERLRQAELSTGGAPTVHNLVDDSPETGFWLGAVVPKRHARRAVTRNLLKRQIRNVFAHHATRLPAGLWVVRLRSPFSPAGFVSAASDRLKRAARAELEQVVAAASARPAVDR